MSEAIDQVSIRFKPGAYKAYRNMNNKVWYALAEYVDNAVQSFLSNKNRLIDVEGKDYQLKINVEIVPGEFIKISDNASGINLDDFQRAFEPANIPLDNTGLSEFGMGMKIASIWFGDSYTVCSKALGENIERTITFDLKKVIDEDREVLDVRNEKSKTQEHYTVVTINDLSVNAPSGNHHQLARIKNHLTSIYRKFINRGELQLTFNGEAMTYEEPGILKAPAVDDPKSKSVLWKKEVNFNAGGFKVTGFIGLLKEMSNVHSGISLFRRGRIIEGSHDDKYHPKILCGSPGSPRDKRLFGDLELEGFAVSFEKGSFLNTEDFDVFLEAIKEDLSKKEFNLLKQGDKYRKGRTPEQKLRTAKKIAKKIEQESTVSDKKYSQKDINLKSDPEEVSNAVVEIENPIIASESFTLDNTECELELNIVNNIADGNLYEVFPPVIINNKSVYRAKLNLDHVFFEKHNSCFKKETDFYPVIDIIKSLIVSEILALKQGTKGGSQIRKNFNHLIREN